MKVKAYCETCLKETVHEARTIDGQVKRICLNCEAASKNLEKAENLRRLQRDLQEREIQQKRSGVEFLNRPKW